VHTGENEVDEAHPLTDDVLKSNQRNTGQKIRQISIQPNSEEKRFSVSSRNIREVVFKSEELSKAPYFTKTNGSLFS